MRTQDPLLADLYYVPVYATCRFQHGASLVRDALAQVRAQAPFFDRLQGQDHVMTITHDFSACFHHDWHRAQKAGLMPELHNVGFSRCSRENLQAIVPRVS